MPAKRIIISGKVQGVFFRASAKEQADALGITGWVKNNSDGTVEACACGENSAVQNFIEWCQKGPPSAGVEDINITEVDKQDFDDFTIRL